MDGGEGNAALSRELCPWRLVLIAHPSSPLILTTQSNSDLRAV